MFIKPAELIPELQPLLPEFNELELWIACAVVNRDSLNSAVVKNELIRYIKFYSPPYGYGLFNSKSGSELLTLTLSRLRKTELINILGDNRRALLDAKLAETIQDVLLKSGLNKVNAIADELVKLADANEDPVLKAKFLKDAADLTLRTQAHKKQEEVVKQAENMTILNAIRSLSYEDNA